MENIEFREAYIGEKNGKRVRNWKDVKYRNYGVYFIRDKRTSEITYIGMSAYCVKDVCYRHFEVWNDKRNVNRAVYPDDKNYEVSIITTPTKQGAVDLERELILKYKPRDNRDKYESHRLTAEQCYKSVSQQEPPF